MKYCDFDILVPPNIVPTFAAFSGPRLLLTNCTWIFIQEEEMGEEEDEEHEEDARERMRSEFAEKFDDDLSKLGVLIYVFCIVTSPNYDGMLNKTA